MSQTLTPAVPTPQAGTPYVHFLKNLLDHAPDSGQTHVSEQGRSVLRVLIIEDDPDTANSLQAVLELLGYDARAAYSGPAGIQTAREFLPDVVMCDLAMPGMDGLAVARVLQQEPGVGRAVLIAVSGYGADSDRLRSRRAGYHLHLLKPLDPEQMHGILSYCAQRRQLDGIN